MTTIERGFCQCGCGQKTAICQVNYPKRGFVKGEPKAFIHGHNTLKHGRSYKGVAITGGTRELHRVIAERALGKPLPTKAQVHHADGDHLNNANSNLVICQDVAYHKLLHMRMRVKAAGGNPNTDLYCHGCRSAKPADAFHRHPRHLNGRQSRCKECAKVEEFKRQKTKAQKQHARLAKAS